MEDKRLKKDSMLEFVKWFRNRFKFTALPTIAGAFVACYFADAMSTFVVITAFCLLLVFTRQMKLFWGGHFN